MESYLDYTDPTYREAAADILHRHDNLQAEANITSAIRAFLTLTGLAEDREIVEEKSPALGSRHAVDLVALDTFIEVKRRVSTTGGFTPNPDYVQQLDEYLAESGKEGRVRMGVLTDGKHWLLRWPNAGRVQTVSPYGFTLDDPGRGYLLFEWLRDHALMAIEVRNPDRVSIASRFGPQSPSYDRDIESLRGLYRDNAASPTVVLKRELWETLLTAALGEIAGSRAQMDDLFVRHTYLSAVIGMIVQARFGVDIVALAATNPADLLNGGAFRYRTGLQGIVESDFFAWPTEVEGSTWLLQTLSRAVTRFNWLRAPTDVASILYEIVIPPEERRQLGEYYTPSWLAHSIVQETVTEPLRQTVLDPSCGSGTFIAEAIRHFLAAADGALTPRQKLNWLRTSITGIDIHPVAVHLARAAWVLAAQPALQEAAAAGEYSDVTAPIYLGDSLQTRYRNGELFTETIVSVEVEDKGNTRLEFPRRLVEDSEAFDQLMGDLSLAIERGNDPHLTLNDHKIVDGAERKTLEATINTIRQLHTEGRDHIWTYYTRNLVRPVMLARRRVDVIVGNPPWLNYNRTKNAFRTALERMSRQDYDLWVGGQYATQQDIAGLFFARCVDLYLREGGVIGMVMPHSALQTGQYRKWRSGEWRVWEGVPRLVADFGVKAAWDLEKLKPNTFFPVASSVVFAQRLGENANATPLHGRVEQWTGQTGTAEVRRAWAEISDTSLAGESPYNQLARNGATIFPRVLFFVNEQEDPSLFMQAPGTMLVAPRRGTLDKAPWSKADLTSISDKAVETQHVFNIHLGETIVPYATLEPLKAVLPLKQGDAGLSKAAESIGGIDPGVLGLRMRERWEAVSEIWEGNKSASNKKALVDQLDYYGKLSAQLAWRSNQGIWPMRIIYGSAGQPTAAALYDSAAIVENTLFWVTCKDIQEVRYLLGIINSDTLQEAVRPFMAKGQFGARHLHKQLWKLPIPAFDSADPLHMEIAMAGAAAEAGVARELATLRADRGDDLSVTIARRELRSWLRSSPEGTAVEAAVGKLLAG